MHRYYLLNTINIHCSNDYCWWFDCLNMLNAIILNYLKRGCVSVVRELSNESMQTMND